MGQPPHQFPSLPLTQESIWGKMFTLKCEKGGDKNHTEKRSRKQVSHCKRRARPGVPWGEGCP